MWFALDGNRPPWENEWSESLHPATSQERVQGSKTSRFKSQTTQKERSFYQNKPSVTAIAGGCWINRSVGSVLHIHLKPSFAAKFTSREKGKGKKRKRWKNKTKQNNPTPPDYRGNGNVPVFTVANTILIKPKLLLRSLSNKYFSIILIFS